MYNLDNILKAANIIFKKFPYRHLATVDKRFVTLQRIRIVRDFNLIVEKNTNRHIEATRNKTPK